MTKNNSYDVAVVGHGFIGSAISNYLAKSYDVKTFDLVEGKSVIPIDICDMRTLTEKLGNPKVIINSAIIQIPKINEKKELGYSVNVIGTQNLCKFASTNPNCNGFIQIGTWHTFGENDNHGVLYEDSGYKPDKVEDRARLYALSKTIQECVVRFYDEKSSDKIFGVLKIGTVLGTRMSDTTVASLFIEKGIAGEKLTPYTHSINRQIFYVALDDVCKAVKAFVDYMFEKKNSTNSINHVINVAYPEPITVLELADFVCKSITINSDGNIMPKIQVVDTGVEQSVKDIVNISIDISKLHNILNITELKHPKYIIDELVREKLQIKCRCVTK